MSLDTVVAIGMDHDSCTCEQIAGYVDLNRAVLPNGH